MNNSHRDYEIMSELKLTQGEICRYTGELDLQSHFGVIYIYKYQKLHQACSSGHHNLFFFS